jgi:hypothetical protein
MHAVVIRVTINDLEAATKELGEQIVPRTSQAPGFVAGYWTRKDNSGLAMLVYESEDAARSAAERTRDQASDYVTIDDVEVREVSASA